MAGSWAQTQAIRLSAIVAAFAFCLIVVAGVDLGVQGVRSVPALSAPDSPLSATHLFVALLTSVATLSLAALASSQLRADGRTVRASLFAALLIVVQLVVVVVPWSTPSVPWVTAIHFGATALLLATALSLAISDRTHSWLLPSHETTVQSDTGSLIRVTGMAAAGVLAVMISGAYLGAVEAPENCMGWPLCSTGSSGISLLDPQNTHRILVGVSGALLVATAVFLLRARARLLAPMALLGVFAAEALVGAISANGHHSTLVSGTHFGAAGAAWAILVLVGIALRPGITQQDSDSAAHHMVWRQQLRDYLRVTKPGIMLLLLITTLGAMLIAPGWPSIWLVLATLLGGALASGGASALNCYLDRDIDVVMARTRKRPIPTGSLSADQVRTFGLLLSAAAVVELWVLVNPVAALLALGGNVFYVVIYTRFLKRSTPQNIVIGGAAGAFPPLVGWAAVTGSVSLTSVLLFALIYYWTPPHFWSLALLKAKDYQRAGIPMLPVTHGEHQTRRHILLYSIMLVAITLLLVPAGAAGIFYLVVASILGLVFVALAARMYREGSSRLAWRLFKYSNYYLAAILLAMVVDRAFPS